MARRYNRKKAATHTEPEVPSVKPARPPAKSFTSNEPWTSEVVGQMKNGMQVLGALDVNSGHVFAKSARKSKKDVPDIVMADRAAARVGLPTTKAENRRREKARAARLAETVEEREKRIASLAENWPKVKNENEGRETARERLGMSGTYMAQSFEPVPAEPDDPHCLTQDLVLTSVSPYCVARAKGYFDDVYSMYGMEMAGFRASRTTCGTPIMYAHKTHGKKSPFMWFPSNDARIACNVCSERVCSNMAEKGAKFFMGTRLLQELGHIDGQDMMAQHTTYSFSDENVEESQDPKKRQNLRRRSDSTMKKNGFRFGFVLDHHLRMNDDLKGGNYSLHRHYFGPCYVDIKAYEKKYFIEIAEFERYQRLVDAGKANPEPPAGPRRLSWRRRFARTGKTRIKPKRAVRSWKRSGKRVPFPGPVAKLSHRQSSGPKRPKPVCPGARNISLDALEIADHVGRHVPARPVDEQQKNKRLPRPVGNLWGRVVMKSPHPWVEVYDTTGDLVHQIQSKINGRRVQFDNFDAVYRGLRYGLSHASFEAGLKTAGNVVRYVGGRREFAMSRAMVNNSDLLSVTQKAIYEKYFESPDMKRYPKARLEEVTFHTAQTGKTRLSLVGFRDIKVDRKGVTMNAAQFHRHILSTILAPRDKFCDHAVTEQLGYPATNTATSTKNSRLALHFPSKGPPDDKDLPQAWDGCRDEVSMTAYIIRWSIPAGTHTTESGEVVHTPVKFITKILIMYWDPTRRMLCPYDGTRLSRVIPADKLTPDMAFTGKYGTGFSFGDGDLLVEYDRKDHLFEGDPIMYEGALKPKWTQSRPVPNARLATMPAHARLSFRTEEELAQAKVVVKMMISDEFPSSVYGFKDLRRARRLELKPIAERYLLKYGAGDTTRPGWESDVCNGILRMEEFEKRAVAKFAEAEAGGQTQLKK